MVVRQSPIVGWRWRACTSPHQSPRYGQDFEDTRKSRWKGKSFAVWAWRLFLLHASGTHLQALKFECDSDIFSFGAIVYQTLWAFEDVFEGNFGFFCNSIDI